MEDYILRTENLRTYFSVPAGYLHAVDNVTIKIRRGTTLGVVGESGCGKSTLGRTVLHLTPVTGGKVWYNDRDISKLSKREIHELRKEMQMIFQDPYSSLNPRMDITALIGEPMDIYHLHSSKKEREEHVKELMDLVGLAPRFARSYPHELDGGRRQRIGIARALSLDPSFIVCDEPVSALDVSIQAQILNILMDIQEQKKLTYMFITHDLSVVRHISDEICVMYLGRIVEQCEAKELFRTPLHPYTQALLAAIPSPDIDKKGELTIIKGEVTSPVNPPKCCRFASRCPFAAQRCHHEEPVLKDIEIGHLCACFKVQGEI